MRVVAIFSTALVLIALGVTFDLTVLHRWVPDPGSRLAVIVVWSIVSVLVLQAVVVLLIA